MINTLRPFVLQYDNPLRALLIWAENAQQAQEYAAEIETGSVFTGQIIPLNPEDIFMPPSMLSLYLPVGQEGEVCHPHDKRNYREGFIIPHFLKSYHRAVIYTRVSTKQQTKGHSLECQNNDCSAFAEAAGYEVISRYSEVESGASYLARPQLQSALQDIELGKAEVLLVASRDRLVRDKEISEKIHKRVQGAEGQTIYVREHIPGDPEHKIQLNMAQQIHEFKLSLAPKWGLIQRNKLNFDRFQS